MPSKEVKCHTQSPPQSAGLAGIIVSFVPAPLSISTARSCDRARLGTNVPEISARAPQHVLLKITPAISLENPFPLELNIYGHSLHFEGLPLGEK